MHKSMIAAALGAWLFVWGQAAVAMEQAARAALVRGTVTALDEGESRKLSRNDLIHVGDLIRTGPKGLVQLVFPDRSMLYVKADTELRIEAFHFDPANPEADSSVATVLKGGMRAISGLVGKRNPEKVEYNTRVSTIGIRGTAVDVQQGGPDCLNNPGGQGCGEEADTWSVTFDFGHGWVETEGGRVDLEQGQTVHFTRKAAPLFARFDRRRDDPAFIIRQFAQMSPNQIEAWTQEQAFRLRKEDLYLALGMFQQSDRFTTEKFSSALRGFSRSMSREERSELREFSSRFYPAEGQRIMRSTTLNKNELSASLESVLRGMENAEPAQYEQVYKTAVEMGITKQQAEKVLDNLKENPLQCR